MAANRVAKWDNTKFLMIVCVVLGHCLYEFMDKHTGTAKSVYLFIYTFHMPVFIFLTGLFARHMVVQRRYDRVINYLLIYLFMKFLEYFGRCMTSKTRREDFFSLSYLREIRDGLTQPKKGFHLFWEDGPAWFALAVAVFILVTILIQDVDRRLVLTAAIILGCLAGLDNHLGNHFASMRICTFYPVFLWGYYVDNRWFELTGRILIRILSALFLAVTLIFCLKFGPNLYGKVDFLKGKCDYMALGLGVNGMVYRLFCYGLWLILITAIISICPRRNYFWTWLGTRTMSVFIWHKFVLIILLRLFCLKYTIKHEMPHSYMIAACSIAVIVTVLTSYLPDLRIDRFIGRTVRPSVGKKHLLRR